MPKSTLDRIADERESRRAAKAAVVAERRSNLLDAVDTAALMAATGLMFQHRYARSDVSRFYGIGRDTALRTIQRNSDELTAAGYDGEVHDEFSLRALILFGLLLRANTSDNASLVQRIVDPSSDRTQMVFGPGAGKDHTESMGAVVQLVAGLTGKARMGEAGEVWRAVRELGDWERNAALVTLLWMARDQADRMARIKRMDPDWREHPMGGSVAAGLATVIPTRNTAHGLTVGDAFEITDAVVGLA
jgi:hypothetical protein